MPSDRPSVFAALLLVAGVAAAADAAGQARGTQAENPTFEVASVKANRSGELGARTRPGPDGSLVVTNSPLPELIELAYGYPANRIQGLPRWAYEDRFDISARSSDQPPSMDRLTRMLRSLLADRFMLKTHVEVREVPVYELRMERGDRRLGPTLTITTRADCQALARGDREALRPPRDPDDVPCGIGNASGSLHARGAPFARLVEALGRLVDRPVIDRTGLNGFFDADLSLRSDTSPFPVPVPVVVPPDSTASSIFTAVREQLALRLAPARGDAEVLVVNSVERPTSD